MRAGLPGRALPTTRRTGLPEGVVTTSIGRAAPRLSTSIRPPISSATAGMRRSMPAASQDGARGCSSRARRARSTRVSDIWAPKYRQAAYRRLPAQERGRATRRSTSPIAMSCAAFDAFLDAQPADEPIILAGHSQGSLHLSAAAGRSQGCARRAGSSRPMSSAGRSDHGRPAGDRACRLHAPGPGRLRASAGRASRSRPIPRLVTKAWVGTSGLTGGRARARGHALHQPAHRHEGRRGAAGGQSWDAGARRRPHRSDAGSRAASGRAATRAS